MKCTFDMGSNATIYTPSEISGFTALTVKNAVFWDITEFVPHRRYITSALQTSAG
jgi:hypothetical protein